MRHPYVKYIKLELLTIVLALIFATLTIIYKKTVILLFTLCLLALSLLSEAAFLYFTNKKVEASKQTIRSLILLLVLIAILKYFISTLT